jgi:hypothetical protein
MKVRLGFVSNSSSSSFICSVCGEVESGMDASLSDFGMFECKNGHTVCESHLSKEDKEKFDKMREEVEEGDEDEEFDVYSVDPKLCPVCKLEELPDDLMLQFVLKSHNSSKGEVLEEIRNQFSSYKEFSDFVGKKRK